VEGAQEVETELITGAEELVEEAADLVLLPHAARKEKTKNAARG